MKRLTLEDLEAMERDLKLNWDVRNIGLHEYYDLKLKIDNAKNYVCDAIYITEEEFDRAWIKKVSTGDIWDLAEIKKELGL